MGERSSRRISILATSTRFGEPIALPHAPRAPESLLEPRSTETTLPSIAPPPPTTDVGPSRPAILPIDEEAMTDPCPPPVPSAPLQPLDGIGVCAAPPAVKAVSAAPSVRAAAPRPATPWYDSRNLAALPVVVGIAVGVAATMIASRSPGADAHAPGTREATQALYAPTPPRPQPRAARASSPERHATSSAAPPPARAPAPFDLVVASKAILGAATRATYACDLHRPLTAARAFVTFAPSGHVLHAHLDPAPPSHVAPCVLDWLRLAAVPPFEGGARTVVKRVPVP